MTEILITGAGGFIGSKLAELLSRQADVRVYRLYREIPPGLPDTVHAIRADFAGQGWVEQLPQGIEVIIHLAQSRQYRRFPEGAEDMFTVNVGSTMALLRWGARGGIRRFVFASTGNVYKPGKQVFKESDECQPTSMYAATKLSAEHLIRQYANTFETLVCRIFTTFGPGQTDMLVQSMAERIRNGEPIRLAGGKGIHLTPIHVDQVCTAIKALASGSTQTLGDVVNLAGPEQVSLAEIVDVIGDHLGIEPVTEATDAAPRYLCGDSSKISTLIDEWKSVLDPGSYLTERSRP